MSKGGAKLSGKCYVGGVSYRPSLDEVRAYYSRTDVLNEILGAMRRWHVRLEPGEKLKHRWFKAHAIAGQNGWKQRTGEIPVFSDRRPATRACDILGI